MHRLWFCLCLTLSALLFPFSVHAQTFDQNLNGLNPALLSSQAGLGNDTAATEQNLLLSDGLAGGQNVGLNDSIDRGRLDINQDDNISQIPLPRSQSLVTDALTPANRQQIAITPEGADQQALGGTLPLQGGGAGRQGGASISGEPFTPLGLRAGKFIIRPSLSVDTGYSSNSTNDVTGSGSAFVSVTPSLGIESDFSRHSIAFQVQGGLDRFASGDDTSDLEVITNLTGQYDIDDDTAIIGRFEFAAQEDDLTGVADDPLEFTTTAGIQLDHVIGKINTQTELRFSRNVNGDFVDAAGILQDQDDLNSSLIGINLRGTYLSRQTLSPFVEVDASREIFDEDTDIFGNERNVTALRGLVGIDIDRGEKFNGEIAIGFEQNLIDGSVIEDFGAFVTAFDLNWSPRRLTTIQLTGSTTLDAFPSIATPGDTTYDFDLNVTRDLRENLTAIAGTGLIFQVDGADLGTDTTVEARLGLEYQLNRYLELALDYDFARQFTADGVADFTANTISLGVRAER